MGSVFRFRMCVHLLEVFSGWSTTRKTKSQSLAANQTMEHRGQQTEVNDQSDETNQTRQISSSVCVCVCELAQGRTSVCLQSQNNINNAKLLSLSFVSYIKKCRKTSKDWKQNKR